MSTAVIYSPTTDQTLTVDPTSKAIRGGLYDAAGAPVPGVFPARGPTDRQQWGFFAHTFLKQSGFGVPTNMAALVNDEEDILVRIRQIYLNVSCDTANGSSQARMIAEKLTLINTGITNASIVAPTPKRLAGPSAAAKWWVITSNLTYPTPIVSRTTVAEWGVPQSAGAIGPWILPMPWATDSPDTELTLYYQEALGFAVTSSGGTAVDFMMTIDWDEERV